MTPNTPATESTSAPIAIAAIIFAVQHWRMCKTPFIVYMGSSAASFLVFMMMFAGMMKMAAEMSM